jgi:hypothetical protein
MGEILSAISILLVFLTILLDLTSKEVNEIISQPKPDRNRTKELSAYNSKTRKVLFGKVIPIILSYIVTAYILLPKTIDIFRRSEFKIWNFDTLLTLFVSIELGLIVLVTVSIYLALKLISKLKK